MPSEPTRVRLLRVVLASPGDVATERARVPAVIDRVNRGVAGDRGVRLELHSWETDTYPDIDERGAQAVIDRALRPEAADVFIGVFWRRFGTPVWDARSGTEHEYLRALRARQKGQKWPTIMVYFSQRAFTPTKDDLLHLENIIGSGAISMGSTGSTRIRTTSRSTSSGT